MPPPPINRNGRESFYTVLTQAVVEITKYGYDSVDRIQYWLMRLRDAAIRSLLPSSFVERTIKATLQAIFTSKVERAGLLKLHPGVERFTIEQVKSRLLAELDRAIHANTSMIKLNRDEAVETTLRRFAGWATSVPAGGSDVVDKQEVKAKIKKPLQALSFQERRVSIDQAHKFTSSLSSIIAMDGNAIAAKWHSNWRQLNYNYREDHKERDEKVYAIRDNWAMKEGLMKAGPNGYTDQITQPAEEVYCFPGDTLIHFADNVEVAYRRWYSGELTEIVTASGKTLRATPNHPIMTTNGFVAIGSLQKGDSVIEVSEECIGVFQRESNCDNATPLISDIFCASRLFGRSEIISGQSQQFHGDGTDYDVDIVYPTRPLTFGRIPATLQFGKQFDFSDAVYPSSGICSENFSFFGIGAIPSCFMGISNECFSSFYSFSSHSQNISLGCRSNFETSFLQSFNDRISCNSETLCDRENTFPGLMRLEDSFIIEEQSIGSLICQCSDVNFFFVDSVPQIAGGETENGRAVRNIFPFATQAQQVIDVKKSSFRGHVYNLQTRFGWYVSAGIITSNCRCHYEYIYNLRDLPDNMLTTKGRDALESVRID